MKWIHIISFLAQIQDQKTIVNSQYWTYDNFINFKKFFAVYTYFTTNENVT